MAEDTEPKPNDIRPANDNQGPDGGRNESDHETRRQLEQVTLIIARLIGRRIARKQFAALSAANDNRPQAANDAEDEAGKD
ncbi:hypothetical protein [Bradyrhizobium sp. SZCCHNS1054]|uniref:hypothetical protein n=1 Tax=Bradyrhizobium sp. SZCCHNS1054 TaxID=3057301 RepID=UPI0029160C85|nr:hypothetical protein [Bradyrhizobium sp. SZCCHNS1054]